MSEDRLAEIEALRDASGIVPPMMVTEERQAEGWVEGGLGQVNEPGVYVAWIANDPAAQYIMALLNNADWLIARIRALEAQAARYKAGLLDLAIEIGGCRCGPEYTSRGLIAPDCAWHQSSTPEILEEVGLMEEYQTRIDAALAAREGE